MYLESGLLLQLALVIVTFLTLLFASYTDLRWREVPDWLSYGLLFSALGIRTIFSLQSGWGILLSGLFGFLVCFALACFFYYSNQWGGGDSKLLMGVGATIGITWPLGSESINLLWFFLALMFLGAIYGLIWMSYLALQKSDLFMTQFKHRLKKYNKFHLTLLITTISVSIIGIFYYFVLPLIFFPLTVFYLFLFVSTVEENCFFKSVSVKQLTEGDWLGKDITIQGKKIMECKTLERADLIKLRKLNSKLGHLLVTIKEGIPFVPSFLLAYIMVIFGKKVVEGLISFI